MPPTRTCGSCNRHAGEPLLRCAATSPTLRALQEDVPRRGASATIPWLFSATSSTSTWASVRERARSTCWTATTAPSTVSCNCTDVQGRHEALKQRDDAARRSSSPGCPAWRPTLRALRPPEGWTTCPPAPLRAVPDPTASRSTTSARAKPLVDVPAFRIRPAPRVERDGDALGRGRRRLRAARVVVGRVLGVCRRSTHSPTPKAGRLTGHPDGRRALTRQCRLLFGRRLSPERARLAFPPSRVGEGGLPGTRSTRSDRWDVWEWTPPHPFGGYRAFVATLQGVYSEVFVRRRLPRSAAAPRGPRATSSGRPPSFRN